MTEIYINKRTTAEVMRNFNKKCLSCKFSKIVTGSPAPKMSTCTALSDTVNHFFDSCQFWEQSKKLKPLQFIHIDFLINETKLLK